MTSTGNALLSSLPPDELERIGPHLRRVELRPGEPLFAAGEPLTYMYFLESGAVARLVQLRSGETIEAGIFGNDGVAGLPFAHKNGVAHAQVLSLLHGTAMTLPIHEYRAFVDGPSAFYDALVLEAGVSLMRMAQVAACHALHRLEQRLTRCLLTIVDYASDSRLPITHDALAGFLGVHRPSVTYALQTLAQNGAIALERRRVIITDRAVLMNVVCECYATIRALRSPG